MTAAASWTMNGRQHHHQSDSVFDDQRPSLSSTTSSDKSVPVSAVDRQADSWRAEAARQWASTGCDAGGDGGRVLTVTERLASFRSLLVRHWHAAVTYCAVFWSFGMCVAFLGPTLLDLGCVTASDMRAVSWVFFVQLLCSLLGASAASYLVKRCASHVSRTCIWSLCTTWVFKPALANWENRQWHN